MDTVFANGIEAIFGFSLVLLHNNEEAILKLKFDQILEYLKSPLFDAYKASLRNLFIKSLSLHLDRRSPIARRPQMAHNTAPMTLFRTLSASAEALRHLC